jgi:hypothetical protein
MSAMLISCKHCVNSETDSSGSMGCNPECRLPWALPEFPDAQNEIFKKKLTTVVVSQNASGREEDAMAC